MHNIFTEVCVEQQFYIIIIIKWEFWLLSESFAYEQIDARAQIYEASYTHYNTQTHESQTNVRVVVGRFW